jgi:L-methionine (R)-S-oxide reductase
MSDVNSKKAARYQRVYSQLQELLTKTDDVISRMATISAVLHHKMDGFFWTGFYILKHGKLLVGPYQGPVACQELKENTGVCWAGIKQKKTILVPDVHKFPGHIACDARSNSEIVVPIRKPDGTIIGVLDIDSKEFSHFNEIDAEALENIVNLIYHASNRK